MCFLRTVSSTRINLNIIILFCIHVVLSSISYLICFYFCEISFWKFLTKTFSLLSIKWIPSSAGRGRLSLLTTIKWNERKILWYLIFHPARSLYISSQTIFMWQSNLPSFWNARCKKFLTSSSVKIYIKNRKISLKA